MKRIVKTVDANLFRGIEGVGGNLNICEDCLWFQPHGLNFQTQPIFIPYETIIHVETCMTWGIIPNGLKIISTHGHYRFVVWRREQLKLEILFQLDQWKKGQDSELGQS